MTLPKFNHDDAPQNDLAAPAKGLGNVGGGDSFDEPKKPMPKALKWAAGTAVGLVLLAGLGGVVATQMLDQQKYKTLIVTKVEEATGYKINWEGDISLGLMPLPHATVNKLTVVSQDVQLLTIEKADVQIALSPLLSQKLIIKNVTLDEPIVRLLTTKDGQQTWMPTAQKSEAAPSEESGAAASEEGAFEVVVKGVDMNGGSFYIENQQTNSAQQLKDINLNIRADSMKGPFDISGNTKWNGKRVDIEVTSGEVNASEGNYPLQANLSMPEAKAQLSFAGVVNSTTMSADGDVDIDVDDVAKAMSAITAKNQNLPEGLNGKASLAGKVTYGSDKVAFDEIALSLGKLSYSGGVSATGLDNKNGTPQVSLQLSSKARADAEDPQLVKLLADMNIAAKGSMEDDKIQITSANIKTLGNNISVNGHATLGATPNVDLTVNASEINLDALGGADASQAAGQKAASSASSKLSDLGFALPFTGRVRADVAKLTTGGKSYSNIKADVTSQNGALTITKAEALLPQDSSVNVTGKIDNTSNMSGLNLKVAAKTSNAEALMTSFGVTPPDLPAKISSASLNGNFNGDLKNLGFSATVSALQFNVKGEGAVGDPMGTPTINSLKFNVSHPNFNEALKTFQPGFAGSSGFYGGMDLSGQLAWGDNKFSVSGLSGKLGQTTVNGDLSAVTQPKTKLSGALSFGAIVLPSATDTGGTVQAASKSSSAGAKGDRWSREAIDTAWMKSFDADLSIKAKSITQNLWKLNDANLAFKLSDGTLTLDDVSAGLFGGRASINGVMKSGAGAKDPLSISAKMNADNVNAQELMSAIMGKPAYVLSGTLSNVDVAINATGSSAANLIQTLDGNGSVNGNNITVTGVDIVALSNAATGSYKPLERLGALSKSMGTSNQTKFDTFVSEFTIEDGVVNMNKALFDSADASMNSTGNVNLPAWTINMTNKLTLKSNEAEPISFTLKGSLDNPAQAGLESYLGDRINKLINKEGTTLNKTLGKLLGVEGKKTAEPTPTTTTTPATDSTAPSAAPATESGEGTAAPEAAAPAPLTKEEKQQQKAEEAVKAIQGLFGR